MTVQITAAPAVLGRSLLALARTSERAAAAKPGGAGAYLTRNPRRGIYFEKEQSGPQCAGQPGTEADFATAYGSPRPNVEPTLLQIQVAAEAGTTSEYDLGRLERIFFATGH